MRNWKAALLGFLSVILAITAPTPSLAQGGVVFIPPITANHCAKWLAANILQDSGGVCGTGSGSVTSIIAGAGLTGGTITTTGTIALDLTNPNTWTGVQSFTNGDLSLLGSGSGNSLIEAPATGGGTATLPAGSGTLVYSGATGDFPITLGSTSIASGSTTTSVTGLSIAQGSSNTGSFAGTLTTASSLTYGGASSAAFGTTGVSLIGTAYTQTDSTTGVGTVATAYGSLIGANTFATAVNAVTITNGYNLYITKPVAGSHVTGTNLWALGADSALINGALTSTGTILAGGGAAIGWTGRLSLSSGGAGILNMGGNDVASPQAQTIQAQSVVAGNANTAGGTFTIAGSKSNGSGGGDMVFQTTLSNAASGTQNTLATALTLKGGTQAGVFAGALSATLAQSTAADVACYAVSTGLFTYEPTGTTCTISARRFKNSIVAQNLDHDYATIMGVKPVSFRFNKSSGLDDGQIHHGLIAEDMEKVAPELVAYEKDGQTHGIKYGDGELQSYIIGAMQEQAKITAAQIASLKSENARLRAANDNLRAQEASFNERLSALEHPKRKMASAR